MSGLVTRGKEMVSQLGGYRAVWLRMLRECTVRTGDHVGTDRHGNKYFENTSYILGRSRFVEFPYAGRMEYDGSQISAEWHAWMHYMTDDIPTFEPMQPERFQRDHVRNVSGTKQAYVPYSTTKPKIQAWTPTN